MNSLSCPRARVDSVSRHSLANIYWVLTFCTERKHWECSENFCLTIFLLRRSHENHICAVVSKITDFYVVICLFFSGLFIPNQRQRNIYLYPLLSSNYFFFFFIRTPRKQSSSCPFFSGQAVLRPWWNMSLVALVSSSICLRRLASSPSC